jgi:hypothetical protein
MDVKIDILFPGRSNQGPHLFRVAVGGDDHAERFHTETAFGSVVRRMRPDGITTSKSIVHGT